MKVLAVTQLWPNQNEPLFAPFNRQQWKALSALCELRVLAALPWFPLAGVTGVPRRPAMLHAHPRHDEVDGVATTYMHYAYVPVVGDAVAVPLYARALRRHANLLAWADVVLASWAFPDGCATVQVCRQIGKPCVVKVHGSDINRDAQVPTPRRLMQRWLPQASAVVAVSRPLATAVEALGVPSDRVTVVPNGVDDTVFYPQAKGEARRALGAPADSELLLFVGRLEAPKGVGTLLEAFRRVAPSRQRLCVALVGEGSLRQAAHHLAEQFAGRVFMPGAVPLPEVARWMGAADMLVLPSHAEGTPNVVLEALACGRPVVASNVGGVPDIVNERNGLLVPPDDATALARAIDAVLAREWPEDITRVGAPPSWDRSAADLASALASCADRTKVS